MAKITNEEFYKRLAAIETLPVEEPDDWDKEMLASAEKEKHLPGRPLEEILAEIAANECSGKLIIRIPKTLHRNLKATASAEGVSLNQYILHRLSGDPAIINSGTVGVGSLGH